jgi:hypothetical protein
LQVVLLNSHEVQNLSRVGHVQNRRQQHLIGLDMPTTGLTRLMAALSALTFREEFFTAITNPLLLRNGRNGRDFQIGWKFAVPGLDGAISHPAGFCKLNVVLESDYFVVVRDLASAKPVRTFCKRSRRSNATGGPDGNQLGSGNANVRAPTMASNFTKGVFHGDLPGRKACTASRLVAPTARIFETWRETS